MCGIAGLFDGVGRAPFDRAVIRRMADRIAHRGPDGDGFHDGEGIALGHRRLAIIDLSGGVQPMYSADHKSIVIFNGEIYNFRDLMTELTAHACIFRTRSDTEVILHAWRIWGERCVEKLAGQFAFAIWDESAETLFLARDRLGKKPFYYSIVGGRYLAFASELKALRAWPSFDGKLDDTAIEEFLCYGYVPDPKSIYANVRKLPPGHTLTWRRGSLPVIKPYWDLALTDPTAISKADAAREVMGRLEQAVRLRLIADVPLGAFLSGGVDSSAVVAGMARLGSEPVKTFTIGFEDTAHDETGYARQMAERYKTDHTESIVAPEQADGEASVFDRVIDVYDEPFGDNSALPTLKVCAAARKRVTVALSGDGGDEAFAGYRRYLWQVREHAVRSLVPAGLRANVFGTLAEFYPKLDRAPRFLRAKSTLKELALSQVEAYCDSVSQIDAATRNALYSDKFRARLGGYEAIEVMRHWMGMCPDDRPLLQAQYADMKTWLAGRMLVKVDRASMANSLEVRNPFLDHDFFQWAVNLPPRLKLEGGNYKMILKKALEPYVPHDLLYRPKQGFSMPISAWLRGPWRAAVRTALTGPVMNDAAIVDHAAIKAVLDQHESGSRDHGPVLWNLMILERFLARN